MKFKSGVIPAMTTPLDENGGLNEEALRKFVDYLVEGGVHGLFPAGTIGEFSNMTVEQKKETIRSTLNAARGRVPVLPGTGASGIDEAVEMTKYAEEIGADGAIVVTPYYLSPDQEGIKRYYEEIAESVSLPLFLYNNPGTTGLNLSVETIKELDDEHDNVVGIKDSSGKIAKLHELKTKTSEDFLTMPGRDLLLLPGLLYGCPGGVMGSLNIDPTIGVEIFENFQKGKTEKSKEIQINKLSPLYSASRSVGVFPAGYKKAASLVSGIDLGDPKIPIRPLNKKEEKELRDSLEGLKLL